MSHPQQKALIYAKRKPSLVRLANIITTFANNYHGVLRKSAEIIPIEPDADNAAAGN